VFSGAEVGERFPIRRTCQSQRQHCGHSAPGADPGFSGLHAGHREDNADDDGIRGKYREHRQAQQGRGRGAGPQGPPGRGPQPRIIQAGRISEYAGHGRAPDEMPGECGFFAYSTGAAMASHPGGLGVPRNKFAAPAPGSVSSRGMLPFRYVGILQYLVRPNGLKCPPHSVHGVPADNRAKTGGEDLGGRSRKQKQGSRACRQTAALSAAWIGGTRRSRIFIRRRCRLRFRWWRRSQGRTR